MMDFDTWEPVYDAIIEDFGFDRTMDERAREYLAGSLPSFSLDRITLDDDEVAIVVGAALDETGIRTLRDVDTVICTGDALDRLERSAITVRLVVTDLDSDPASVTRRSRHGGVIAVHAHGDNLPQLERWIPRMDTSNVLGTTQVRPRQPLLNAGGFTDGDRAAYLAHHLGASSISFVGWDLSSHSVSSIKRRKLDWAIRLLTHLETERGEHYPMLDGIRRPLEVSP